MASFLCYVTFDNKAPVLILHPEWVGSRLKMVLMATNLVKELDMP